MKIVDFEIPVTAAPESGAPPEGLVAFYWHFIRQTKGWYAAMFAASLAVALLDTVVPLSTLSNWVNEFIRGVSYDEAVAHEVERRAAVLSRKGPKEALSLVVRGEVNAK